MRTKYLKMEKGDLFYRLLLDYYDRIFKINRNIKGDVEE